MRKSIIALLFLLTNLIFGQSSLDRKVRLDSLFEETFTEKYNYIRICEKYYVKSDHYNIKDFYLSGNLQKEGIYADKDGFVKDGNFTVYYENGYAQKEFSFLNNQPVGKLETWYENGNPKEIGYYNVTEQKENLYTVSNFWDIENKVLVTNGTGNYSIDDIDIDESGFLEKGLKEGKWIGRSKKHKLNFTEYYSRGNLLKGESIDDYNINYTYDKIEIPAESKKGINDFLEFIGKNFQVPKVQGLKGKILIRFYIEVDGSVNEVKVIKGVGYGADEEAIRVIKMYSNWWIPAKKYGKKIRSQYQLPIKIYES